MKRIVKIFFSAVIIIVYCITDDAVASYRNPTAGAGNFFHFASSDTVPEILLRWERNWKKHKRSFSLHDFYLSGTRDFDPENDTTDKRGGSVWFRMSDKGNSPDGIYLLYSVNSGSEGDGESFAYLINTREQWEITLECAGSSGFYEEEGWVDNNVFIITGIEDLSGNQCSFFYTVYDLKKKTSRTYSTKKKYRVTPDDYYN